ncbi:11494_t:CDS:2 [Diversispora eburnea]|uniref:11494_t:CDS:1 n=1 Tax=Diversispora eburnea TaxID=1213867 RepID=A0A9N8UZ46_9GLOM|nr:11494_t:CDS:2 [Diversispora eburnea]
MTNSGADQQLEKYQERILARRRGAGTHRIEFRNFTIEIPEQGKNQEFIPQPLINKLSFDNEQQIDGNGYLSDIPEQFDGNGYLSDIPEQFDGNRYLSDIPEQFDGNGYLSDIPDVLEEEKNQEITYQPLDSTTVNEPLINNDNNERQFDDNRYLFKVINNIISEFLKEQENELSYKKEILHFKKIVEIRILEQLDLIDKQMLLRSSLRKAKLRIKQLCKEILGLIYKRDKIKTELSVERKGYKENEQIRKKLEQVHNFLSDIDILRESVIVDNSPQNENEVLDGFESLLINTTFRCCDNVNPLSNQETGNLRVLSQFNNLLENCERIIRQSADMETGT